MFSRSCEARFLRALFEGVSFFFFSLPKCLRLPVYGEAFRTFKTVSFFF